MKALSAVAVCSAIAAYFLPAGAQLWVSDGAWTAGGVVGVLGLGAAFSKSSSRRRPGWSLLFLAAIAWLLGQCFWDYYSATSFPSSPNAADLLWLAFAALAAAGVHRLGLGTRRRRVSWLEVAPLVIAVFAFLTVTMWGDVQTAVVPTSAVITALAYPVIYVIAVTVMLQSVLAGALSVTVERGIGLLLIGLILEAAASILWTPQLLDASYVVGTNAIDALWTIGMVLIGLGALRVKPRESASDRELVTAYRGGILPSLAFFALAAFQVAYVATQANTFSHLVLSTGVFIVGSSLVARSAILNRQQIALQGRLRSREDELRGVNERLSRESRRDPLTGLGNRLRLSEDLDALLARSSRYGNSYSVALFDVDRFKAYNDTFGHQAGDTALSSVAAILAAQKRDGDQLYRYGGEEILLILTDPSNESATVMAERLRAAVQAADVPHPRNDPYSLLTISGGVAIAQPGESPDHVISRADEALYEAKASGRNSVVEAAGSSSVLNLAKR